MQGELGNGMPDFLLCEISAALAGEPETVEGRVQAPQLGSGRLADEQLDVVMVRRQPCAPVDVAIAQVTERARGFNLVPGPCLASGMQPWADVSQCDAMLTGKHILAEQQS